MLVGNCFVALAVILFGSSSSSCSSETLLLKTKDCFVSVRVSCSLPRESVSEMIECFVFALCASSPGRMGCLSSKPVLLV